MLAILVIAVLVFVVWTVYGRGAYIVYKYEEDKGVLLPSGADKEEVMKALKRELGYKDTKEVFFDEDGEICIAGKNDTYRVELKNGCAYVNDPLYTEISDGAGGAMTFLQMLGRFSIRAHKKRDRERVEELLCIRAYVTKRFDSNAPVNAHKKYTDMVRARKYYWITSGVCLILVGVLLAFSINSGVDSKKIDSVKYAYLENYSDDINIGEAFGDFFANSTWETYTADGEERIKFSGEFLFYDERALAVITFEFMENDWFKVSNIKINGESLNIYEQDEFLTIIYDSYGE